METHEKRQCSGTTVLGRRCRNMVVVEGGHHDHEEDLCWVHQWQAKDHPNEEVLMYHALKFPKREADMDLEDLRKKVQYTKLFEQLTHQKVVDWVNSPDTSIFGTTIKLNHQESNWQRKSRTRKGKIVTNEEINRVPKQGMRLHTIGRLDAIGKLRELGLVPSLPELFRFFEGKQVDIERLVDKREGVSYGEMLGIDLGERIMISAFIVGSQALDLKSVEWEDRSVLSVKRFTSRAGLTASTENRWFDHDYGVNLVNRMTMTTRNTFTKSECATVGWIFGMDFHGAREGVDAAKYAASQFGTNPGWRIMDSWHKDPLYKNFAKQVTKRLVDMATRTVHRTYDSALITENVEKGEGEWWFDPNVEEPIKVKYITTPGNSADGSVCHTSRSGFVKLNKMAGVDKDKAEFVARHYHVISWNVELSTGFLKGQGNIVRDSEWRYPGYDVVVNTGSIDRRATHKAEPERVGFAWTPIRIQDKDVVEVSGRQNLANFFKHVSYEDLPWIAAQVLSCWERDFLEALIQEEYKSGLLMEEDFEEDDGDNPDTVDNYVSIKMRNDDIPATILKEYKKAYHTAQHSMWHGNRQARYAYNKYRYLQRQIDTFLEDGMPGFPMLGNRVRPIPYEMSPKETKEPEYGTIRIIRDQIRRVMHSFVLPKEIMLDEVFQFCLENFDFDDAVLAFLLELNGQYYLRVDKEPCSPGSGWIFEITPEEAEKTGLIAMPRRENSEERTYTQVREWLNNEDQLRPRRANFNINLENYDGLDFTWWSATINHRIGNMPLGSLLLTFAGLCNVIVDKEFYQISEFGVDPTVNKDFTFTHILEHLTTQILAKMRAGTPMHLRYLKCNALLWNHLSQAYREQYPGERKWLDEEGRINPVAKEETWEIMVFQMLQAMERPMQWNAAILSALANGPVNGLTHIPESTTQEVAEIAINAYNQWAEIYDPPKNQGEDLTWNEKELCYYEVAKAAEEQARNTEGYKAGTLSILLNQLYAVYDHSRKVEVTEIPGWKTTPLNEYLSAEESKAFFACGNDRPSFWLPIENDIVLEVGEEYHLSTNGNTVLVGRADFDREIDDLADYGHASGPNAPKWAEILKGISTVRYMGVIPMSNLADDIPTPIGVFVPTNIQDVLSWNI